VHPYGVYFYSIAISFPFSIQVSLDYFQSVKKNLCFIITFMPKIYSVISPPQEGVAHLTDNFKYNVLFIIRKHIHPDLKAEYLMEEDPRAL
jgi:hypothetical protein